MRQFMSANSVFYLQRDVYEEYEEYKDDFKQVIKERETRRLIFLHQSPQIFYRGSLVQYVKMVCIDRGLSHSSLHLAVYLMDLFMDNHHVIPEKLLLVANVCLMISAKLEENALKIPKISELNALIGNRYTTLDYTNLEVLVIQFFNFYLNFPCAVHYVFYYMQEFICYEDLKGDRNVRTLFYDLYDAITVHLDRIIEDVHYMQCYKPSVLAAAVIAASRLDIGLSLWTQQLENLTEYTEEDLRDVAQILLKWVKTKIKS
ncbi:unnamed protein product [Tenebrio molitor]|nr:unnamed protein product [Tenebrio molitor]